VKTSRLRDSASALDRELVRELDLAHDLEFARPHHLDLAHHLARDLDLARDLVGDLDRVLSGVHDIALAGDLVGDLARTLVSAYDLASALGGDFASTRAYARDLAHARDLARDLSIGSVNNLGSARARARVSDLVSDLDGACNIAHALTRTLARDSSRAGQGQRGARRVAPLAGRLLTAVARLLPARDQARYAEEFRSELAEIARAGAGRRRQLAYAARVVLSALRLRADLRAPRRRRAAP
jgi:hypothetical protein